VTVRGICDRYFERCFVLVHTEGKILDGLNRAAMLVMMFGVWSIAKAFDPTGNASSLFHDTVFRDPIVLCFIALSSDLHLRYAAEVCCNRLSLAP
jgi:hypothetical protein